MMIRRRSSVAFAALAMSAGLLIAGCTPAAEEAAEAAEAEKAKVTRGSSRGSRGGSPSRGKNSKKGGTAGKDDAVE